MSRSQRWLAGGLCALAALSTMIPYWLCRWYIVPEDMVFTGVMGVDIDQSAYFMWIKQFADGHHLAENLHAVEPQHARFFHPLFWLIGRLAAWTRSDFVGWYHAFRVALSAGLFYAIFTVAFRLFGNVRSALIAWTLIVFGGGMGWIFPTDWIQRWAGRYQLYGADVSTSDAYVYLGAYRKLVFTAGMLGMLLVIRNWWRWAEDSRSIRLWAAGALCFGLAFTHPYDLVPLAVIAGGWGGWQWYQSQRVRAADWYPSCTVLAGIVPGWLYYRWLFEDVNLGFSLWRAASFSGFPENPYSVLISFSLPMMWLAIGWKTIPKTHGRTWLLLWLCAVAVLVYIPDNHRGKYSLGWMIPIGLLAAFGWLKQASWGRWGGWTAGLLLVFSTSTTWWNLGQDLLTNARNPERTFLFKEDERTLKWIDRHLPDGCIVLSSYPIGNHLPRYTGCKALAGHYQLSPHVEKKMEDIRRFFQPGTTHAWRKALLHEYHVDYIYWGPLERALGTFDPSRGKEWAPVYRTEHVAVFRVAP